MSKLEFTAADFEDANLIHDWLMVGGGIKVTCYSPEKAARLANARLAEILKDAKVVYGRYDIITNTISFSDPQGRQNTANGHEDTHRALLINIEKLPKEPCKHEPLPSLTWDTACRRCGVLLEIIGWKEATR